MSVYEGSDGRRSAIARADGAVGIRGVGAVWSKRHAGDEAVDGHPGDLIFKPRGQWHTFWNAGDEPARILEMISRAGFERYFEQMVDLLERSVGAPDPSELGAIAAEHGLEVDRESIPRLTGQYRLRWGPSQDQRGKRAIEGRDDRPVGESALA